MDSVKGAVKGVAKSLGAGDMDTRQLLTQGVNLGLIVTTALMIWKGLVLFTGSESPVVVVLSGSMEPAFYRGDILFLYMGQKPFSAGEVVVFNINGRDIPIVHRIIKVHEKLPGSKDGDDVRILTKGDNNWGDDRALYNEGQQWLNLNHLMGRVVGYLPLIGQATIIMNDYPYVKYLLIGILGIFVITSKD
ncbi:g6980 [Coccomyxa viridis]|uniref:Signal peptidase complex catalytic subunit SEC11 n=1 Tax=Coccomyxa viridis TaxID=1274662 RepID=A0ABP1FWP5_9CHLO